MKQRVLVIGAGLGLGGGLLTAMAIGTLEIGLGAPLGALLATGLGCAGAWLVSGSVLRETQRRFLALQAESNDPQGDSSGWTALEEACRQWRAVLTKRARERTELVQLDRLVERLRPATGPEKAEEPADDSKDRSRVRRVLDVFGQLAMLITREAGLLSAATERMVTGSVDQTQTVARTATTVEAISDRIDRISQHAEDAAGASDRTRQEASRGLEQIQGIIEGMERLRARVEANARKARRLGDRSEEIGSIVEMIGGISSRTDMLALNASIESVRAGEHGRGFAVVADEIRKLAERAATATREVAVLVESIQAETQESIRALADEQDEMEQEVQRVRKAGSALERISQVAGQSAGLVEGISRSANDQVLATQELVGAMQRISEVARLIHDDTSHVREGAKALEQRCQRLLVLSNAESVPTANAKASGSSQADPRPGALPVPGRSNGAPTRTKRPVAIESTGRGK